MAPKAIDPNAQSIYNDVVRRRKEHLKWKMRIEEEITRAAAELCLLGYPIRFDEVTKLDPVMTKAIKEAKQKEKELDMELEQARRELERRFHQEAKLVASCASRALENGSTPEKRPYNLDKELCVEIAGRNNKVEDGKEYTALAMPYGMGFYPGENKRCARGEKAEGKAGIGGKKRKGGPKGTSGERPGG
ncbi:hypothetical protein GJ744_004515 [Endocarpon pusillum]|uniref:Uncharacterized protein n=1 Tax=Endocarpon pusillum TaxID=364733 RepID=A0A8H7AZX2_9EURO|nr:hypothetical protein GJ744_004515 [Endocarpon pusillum]